MSLELTLPLGKKQNAKNLIFSILSREYPLKLIQLTNMIRKRYGKAVTFQAVRKAALELMDEEVLVKTGTEFQINKEWTINAKKVIDELYTSLNEKKHVSNKIDSLGEEMSVFTFSSVGEMMNFWSDLMDNWLNKIDRWQPNVNCYQASHTWEVLLFPENERKVMTRLIKKKIKSYALITGRTPLDKVTAKFYRDIGVKVGFSPSSASFDREYAVGTYGELVAHTRLPSKIVEKIETFFRKAKDFSNLDLKKLSEIIHSKAEVKLSVIKNEAMAKQINHSIISQIE